VRNPLYGQKDILDTAEGKVSKLDDITVEVIWIELQGEHI
jgi:hypothetical protein